MFAFIFQITIYACTNEHSENGWYCIILGKDVQIRVARKEQKEDGVRQIGLFLRRSPECQLACWFRSTDVLKNNFPFPFLFIYLFFDSVKLVSKIAREHKLNKWLVPGSVWFIFDGSDVSMEVKGLLVYSCGWRGQGVNRLSVAQESFHQDSEHNPVEILESSEAGDGE